MAEWFKAHAWKACVGNTTGGSNPSLSASLILHQVFLCFARPNAEQIHRPSVTLKTPSGQSLIFVACLGLLAGLGWIDFVTGYELGFFIFYSVPVGVAAWHLGQWRAIMVALAASVTWWLADFYNGVKYSSVYYFYWNNAIHFGSFVINAVTISKIKRELDRRHELAAELEAARSALRAVAPFLKACPCCGKPHLGTDEVRSLAVLTEAQRHLDLASAVCDDCRTAKT